jgi:predicted CoA-substrate-specific enzyme activase
MITAGVDIGSTASKAVVLIGREVAAQVVGPSSADPRRTAREMYEKALAEAGVRPADVGYIVGTGYGRTLVDFATKNISEITCHGRGAHFLVPSVRTVIDVGGQDTKVICVDAGGNLMDFVMNDKCAAGTGRFLEAMSRSLGIPIEEMAGYYGTATEACTITSMCSVFAESEVISLLNDGMEPSRIVRGLLQSLASRVASLSRRLGLVEDVVLTGGVAKNGGVRDAIENRLRVELKPLHPADPQLVGAIGAALIAAELCEAEAA